MYVLQRHVIINLLYPPACLLCRKALQYAESCSTEADGSEPAVICDDCLNAMPRSGPPVCVRCGVGLPGAFDAQCQCTSCRRLPLAFEMARAPWQYTGVARTAVRELKYHRRWRIGRWLADEMVTIARSSLPLDAIDIVLPVPLHWLKRRVKGFNPTEQLAQAIAQSLEKPYRPRVLRRSRWTTTQTHLGWSERFRNVRQAFIADAQSVRGRTALLIDDVLTSGATANACALALKEAGVRRVFVLTAARTPLE